MWEKKFNLMLVHHQKGFPNIFCEWSIWPWGQHQRQWTWTTSRIILCQLKSKCVHKKDYVFPNLKQFNDFRKNPGNKIWLQHFLKIEFQGLLLQFISEKFTCHHIEAGAMLFYVTPKVWNWRGSYNLCIRYRYSCKYSIYCCTCCICSSSCRGKPVLEEQMSNIWLHKNYAVENLLMS